MTESEIINQVRSGSEESFDQLMQNYQSHVYNVAFSFTKDSENALDISQDVFVKVYKNLNSFRGESQFKTWLTRIAFNESQNWLKKNKRHIDMENLKDKSAHVDSTDEMLAKENRTILLRSLYELNTKYRLAVVLRYFENYSIREIASTMSCSEGVVKNMLFRSLQKLKNYLGANEFGVNDV
jgi:RNA polymerase sigma-70 factor (ECF subfamily)